MTESKELKDDNIDSDEIKEEESRNMYGDRSFNIFNTGIKAICLIGIVIAISALLKHCGDFWTSFWESFRGF